ncbi:MAG: ABC transporter permease [Deltaproteobacteria bacterium]|nr:ABC transporter permease [Deltaproteobacteria bacterium]
MDLAIRDLKLHKGRFLATIIGVGLLFTIVLTMNGLYRGNVHEGTALIAHTGPDLWVVERDRGGPFNEQSSMPEFFHYSVAAVPGVEQASPFIYYPVERQVKGESRRFSIIGYDVFGGLGGPRQLTQGRPIQQAHYEMVAHEKLGVKLGDRIPLGLHTFTVVGLTREAVATDGEPLVYLSLADAQEFLFQRDNQEVRNQRERQRRSLVGGGLTPQEAERLLPLLAPDIHTINAVLVKLAPDADPAYVARHIQDWLYFSVFTTQEEIDLVVRGRLARMSAQLGFFRILLLFVAVVIISLVIYTFTMEKIRSIAVMKLIGAPNRVVIRMILEESLLMTVSSFLFGLLVIHSIADLFPRKILILAPDTLLTFAIALAGGILASVLGIWQVLKTEPAMALGGR